MKRQFCVFKRLLIINGALLIGVYSCSVSHQITKSADKILLKDSSISAGHIGISIYEPATNTYWYNYDAAKYFVPASNVKLFTCYAGMKYLGDSLVGLRYFEVDTAIYIEPTGDPTFLHDDFKIQPVLDFLKNQKRNIYITTDNWRDEALGKGWAWDDYNESYMAERSPMPAFGNIVKFSANQNSLKILPSYFDLTNKKTHLDSILKERAYSLDIIQDTGSRFTIKRIRNNNQFEFSYNSKGFFSKQSIPFYTDTINTLVEILKADYSLNNINASSFIIPEFVIPDVRKDLSIIHSQPTDSLLKPMIHRSDNFFAEQTLLMVSNEHLGYMNDEDIIDTLLKSDLKDVPQKPKWVDGSGLSRYNLFTPQSFVYILNKMKNDFGLKRLENILLTGGEGTLKNYYLKDSSFIYAKTGSLSNNFSLSGFLITKKNKLLIFSILVNNFQNDAAPVRLAIQQFIEGIREKY
jgi:D-alanyl-D-alanine carboxypeptidase/D-alanyl-D-alanine-endopeptidase (penicillin-binding protein 4)